MNPDYKVSVIRRDGSTKTMPAADRTEANRYYDANDDALVRVIFWLGPSGYMEVCRALGNKRQ